MNTNAVALAPGHRIDLRQPVTGFPHVPDAPATVLTVFAVLVDPELGEIDTPNGHVAFLQFVGVTAAEKARMVEGRTQDVLAELAADNPLLITYPSRS